jgi:phage recombination protein Bet
MKNEIQTATGIDREKIVSYLETMNLTTNLTKQQVQQFIEISQAFGLNPFKREIYASKYGETFSIIVGYETYIKRAERSGRLSGWNVTTVGQLNQSNLAVSDVKAIITIHRKDFEHPFIHEVYFVEYAQKTRDGNLNKFWREKPLTMIKKVAIAQGFRMCFSDELGGMPYTADELGAETVETNYIPMDPDQSGNAIQAKVDPVKRGPGRPKKAEVLTPPSDEPNWVSLGTEVALAESLFELKTVYDNYPQLKNDQQFLQMLSERRKAIQNPIPEDEIQTDGDLMEHMNDETK